MLVQFIDTNNALIIVSSCSVILQHDFSQLLKLEIFSEERKQFSVTNDPNVLIHVHGGCYMILPCLEIAILTESCWVKIVIIITRPLGKMQ